MSLPAHELRPCARRDHAWVVSTWVHGLCEPDGHACVSPKPMRDALRRPGVRCVVAHAPEHEDELYGWAAAEHGALLWVYVRKLYGTLRGMGLGTTLMIAAGADPSKPTPCRYWSPYATLLAERGYRLYYDPRNERTAA